MIEESVKISECPGWLVKPRSRRIAEFSIADVMFLRLFQRPGLTWKVERDPLPEDGRLIGVKYDVMRGAFLLYVESETFDEVPEAEMPPLVSAPTLHVSVTDADPEEGE
jgi:hypothetical protein